jgi:hypothetical protein
MEPQPSSSSSSLNKQLRPEEATKTLDQEHIVRLTEDAYKNLAEYTKAELEGFFSREKTYFCIKFF